MMTRILILLCLSQSLLAQNTLIEGQLINEKDEPLEMANILVMQARDSTMETYAFSDPRGNFSFKLKRGQAYLIKASFLGYRPLDTLLTPQGDKQSLILQLQPASEMLQTVEITENMPVVISGDTISYQTDAFTTGEEKKLGDVLKKLPGVEIDEDGEVTVEGKKVDKVMVEGKDFFDGDSKMAAKNLPADAVDKVQVLKNYEEIQPLKGLSSEDRVALNIKLKEGKKNLWFGDYEIKGGDPDRYFGHINGFYYSPKLSVNFIGDANNIGEAPLSFMDYFRMTGGFRSMSNRSGSRLNFDLSNLGFSLRDNNRAVNNVSNFGAVNLSYNPGKKLSISGFAIASGGKITGREQTLRTYIGLDSLNQEVLTNEDHNSTQAAMSKVSLVYKPSPKTQIIYDALGKITQIRQSQDQFSDFGDFQNAIHNETRQEPYEVNQNFAAYHDAGQHVFSLEAQYKVNQRDPRYLQASSNPPFRQIFPFNDSNRFSLLQRSLTHTRSLEAAAKYYWVLSDLHHLEFTLGFSDNHQELSSRIAEGDFAQAEEYPNPALQNDIDFRLQDHYTALFYKTKWGKFTFRPGLNLHRYRINFEQAVEARAPRDDYFILPEVMLNYELGSAQKITLRYNRSAQYYAVNQVISGLMIQNYNSLFTGNQDLDPALQHSLSLQYFHYNQFDFTNTFAMINYDRSAQDLINGLEFIGLERVFAPINAQGINERINGNFRHSRKYKNFRAEAGFRLSYATTNNEINNQSNQNQSLFQSYNLEVGTNFKKWPNLELDYTLSVNDYSGTGASSTFTNHRPQAELTAVLWQDLVLRSTYQYNNYGQAQSGQRVEFTFWDASLEYQKKESPWTFSLEGLNLLNTNFIREDNLSENLISTTAVVVLPRYVLAGVRYDL